MSEGPHWNAGPDTNEDATPFPSVPGSKQAPLGEAERPAPSRQGLAHTACKDRGVNDGNVSQLAWPAIRHTQHGIRAGKHPLSLDSPHFSYTS